MFAALVADIYGIFEKCIRNKVLVCICYFLTMGALWALVTFCIGWMSMYRDIARNRIDPDVLKLIPLAGFALGEILAFFPWITGLHKSGDKQRRNNSSVF